MPQTGVSVASIDKWKAKFGGMEISEAKRLKSLEDENIRLKPLLPDATLDNAALKDPPLRSERRSRIFKWPSR